LENKCYFEKAEKLEFTGNRIKRHSYALGKTDEKSKFWSRFSTKDLVD